MSTKSQKHAAQPTDTQPSSAVSAAPQRAAREVDEVGDTRQTLPQCRARGTGRTWAGLQVGEMTETGAKSASPPRQRRGSAAFGRHVRRLQRRGRLAVKGHGRPVSIRPVWGPVVQVAEAVMQVPWCPKEPSLRETTSERHIPGGVSPRSPGGSRTRWRRARWNHDHR